MAGTGPASLLESWWYPLYQFVPIILIPLGSMIVAASFVARALERGPESDLPPERRRSISAAWLFWTGLILTVTSRATRVRPASQLPR